MCKTYSPQPHEVLQDNPEVGYQNIYEDTFTMHFLYEVLYMQDVNIDAIFGLLGEDNSNGQNLVSDWDCEKADCLNPCYDNGSCYRCVEAAIEGEGMRLPICE